MIFKIKRTNKRYTDEFKQEAVSLGIDLRGQVR
jgi:transposase-like protein